MCEHQSKRVEKKIKVSEDEIPCAYAATQTRIVFRVTYRCQDCGETWTEEREEWKGI
jgi:transposase-like protein